jgi:hypothetical protein
MYFNTSGIKEGIIKGLKIALYVAISGAVAALAATLKEYEVTNTDVTVGLAIMAANSLIVAVQKWLSTK